MHHDTEQVIGKENYSSFTGSYAGIHNFKFTTEHGEVKQNMFIHVSACLTFATCTWFASMLFDTGMCSDAGLSYTYVIYVYDDLIIVISCSKL